MGLINITFRREQLGNIGSTGMAHGVTDTDIGTVHHTVARHYNPTYFNKQASKGWSSLAKGIESLSGAIKDIKERDDEKKSDELVTHVVDQLDRMDRDERTFTPEEIGSDKDREYLLGVKDAEGNYSNAQPRGLYLRTGEGTRHLLQEADASYGEVFNRLANEIGCSDEVKRKAHLRLAAFQRGRTNYALETQAKEYRRMELEGAKNQLTSFLSSYSNGNVNTLDDIFAAQNKLGTLQGKSAETRQLEEEALAYSLAADAVGRTCDGYTDPKQFDNLIDFLEKNGPEGKLDAVFSEKLTSRLADGGKIGGEQLKKLTEQIASARDKRDRENKSAAARASEQNLKGYQDEFSNIQFALLSPDQATVDKAMDGLDEKAFRRRLDADAALTNKDRLELTQKYANLTAYRDKAREAKAKFDAADAAHKAQFGWVDPDTGVFIPATTFPKESNTQTLLEFGEDEGIWNDVRTAHVKLESARMTGQLSLSDYQKVKGLLRVKSDKEAKAVWEEFGAPTMKELELSGYGLDEDVLSKEQKKWRKTNKEKWERWGGGIWAKTKGTQGGSAASWLADSLTHTEEERGKEEMISPATWAKIYETALRLKRNGVALPEAIRQIVAPTLQAGVERTLAERLSQADYFKRIVDASHAETGFVQDLNQMNEANLIRQGRGKEIEAAKYSDLGNGLRMTKDGSGTIVDDEGNVVTKEHLKNIGGQLYDDIDISDAPEL